MIERSQAGGTGRLLFIINLQFKQQATATANYARREAAKVDCTWSGYRRDWDLAWYWGLGTEDWRYLGQFSPTLHIFASFSFACEHGPWSWTQGHAPGRVKKGTKPDDHRNADGFTVRKSLSCYYLHYLYCLRQFVIF